MHLTLHLTDRCNLACRYCYQRHGASDMPRETAEAAIDRLGDCALDVLEGHVDEAVGVARRHAVVQEPREREGGEERRADGEREAEGERAVDLHFAPSPLRSRMAAFTASSRSGRPLRTPMP